MTVVRRQRESRDRISIANFCRNPGWRALMGRNSISKAPRGLPSAAIREGCGGIGATASGNFNSRGRKSAGPVIAGQIRGNGICRSR